MKAGVLKHLPIYIQKNIVSLIQIAFVPFKTEEKILKLVLQELNHFCHFTHGFSGGIKNEHIAYNLGVNEIS